MTESVSQINVLIVDDQSHVRQWVRTVLSNAGITNVTEASSGREARATVTAPGAHFDLILCDLRMPDGDGVELIRSFASMGLDSAFAILSVEDERVIETAGMLAEAQGLRSLGTFSKPLTPDKLDTLLLRMRGGPKAAGEQVVAAPHADIADAFVRGEFYLVYQPKIFVRTGGFAGVEALARWKHPTLGTIMPAAFMPLLEESDDYSARLAEFALQEALRCAGRWLADGRELHVAVNLSAHALDQLDLPERIESLAKEFAVPTSMLTLEVTETHVARDTIRMLDVATRLRLKGFVLSVDDFGTGLSGLQQLQRLPFNEIKIDRSFVHGCSESPVKRSVVEASLALARSLKMISVAEGVQSRPDWNLVSDLGCDIVQGYFIARPMTEEGLDAWTTQWQLRNG